MLMLMHMWQVFHAVLQLQLHASNRDYARVGSLQLHSHLHLLPPMLIMKMQHQPHSTHPSRMRQHTRAAAVQRQQRPRLQWIPLQSLPTAPVAHGVVLPCAS